MFPRRAQTLWTVQFDGAPALARLGFLEGASRSVVSVVVPLDAFEALESSRTVSITYAIGAVLAMTVTLCAANLERIVLRRWVTTLGLTLTAGAAIVYATGDGLVYVLGIAVSAAGASLFSNTLALYIIENIGKADLARSESTRLLWAGAAWLLGPLCGVLLRQNVAPEAPYLLSIGLATAALAYFWVLRLGSHPVLQPPSAPPPNPLRDVTRYFKQRYLRIAYAIAVVRATIWVAVFVYVPIYVIDAGLPSWVSGAFLSSLAVLLFTAPIVAALARARGTRAVVGPAYGLIGTGLLLVAALPTPMPIGLLGWSIAAIGASALDVVGNLPFMRTVKPRERVPMTGVFSTWRDTSTILAPALAAAVLTIAPLRAYYGVLAILAVLTASTASLLPRRL